METFGWSRPKSLWSLLAGLFVGGVVIALGFGPWQHIQIAGRDFFGLADYISGNVFLTVGGLAISLYVGLAWGFEQFRDDTNLGAGRFRVTSLWGPVMRFVAPIAVTLVVLAGLGILG
jgi:NSS family neurotransmitter:Na+ symporter